MDSSFDLPIACARTPAELRSRGSQLLPGLIARASERTPLANGFRWSFAASGELLRQVADVIDAERRCCRFLRFQLILEPDAGALSLEVTGPAGTVAFLEQLIAEAAAQRVD